MKNFKLRIVFLTIAALAMLASCNLFFPAPIEIGGTWDLTGGGTWEITDETFKITNDPSWTWDYSGEVISYSNDSYNDATENPTTGDFGHMVIKFTAHTGNSSAVGTYTVVRWKTLVTASGVTTMEYSEGYKAGADAFTSADMAKTGATEADGYFGFFSSITKQ